MKLLERYAPVAGEDVIGQLQQLGEHLRGRKVVHVNSTRVGGGVAEILAKLVPLKRELGIDATWKIIEGDQDFYKTTKSMHNALQGSSAFISTEQLRTYESTNERNAGALRDKLEDADFVFIHDPQPAPLLRMIPKRRGKWVWRCHIDVSRPDRHVWKYLRGFVSDYDASIFSLAAFSQELPHTQYVIPPSIDPLSDKNVPLSDDEIDETCNEFGLDRERDTIVQVSRFDRFKDPVGVIAAYRLAKKFSPGLQLVLAGGGATDDPEGEVVLEETRAAAGGDTDIHILVLPPDAHRRINALQRTANVVLQKSTREGFGLTVAEGMWKGKPVIGGDVGGIRLQIVNHHTGFLVATPEGAALRIRYLLHHPDVLENMGEKARLLVRNNFLLTRHLREYLTVMASLLHGAGDRMELF